MSPYGSYILETVLTLVAVSLLAFVLLYAARKAGVGRAMGGLDLVGRLPIDARRSIVLVRVGPQVFVVGVSEAGLTKLGELPSSDIPPPASVVPPGAPFQEVLRNVLGKNRDREAGEP